MTKANGKPLCGAKRKNGEPCRRPAGWGTPHVGSGRCKMHLGNARNHLVHAARAMALVAITDLPEIEPHEALLVPVRAYYAQVMLCRNELAKLDEEALVGPPLTLTIRTIEGGENGDGGYAQRVEGPAEANIWWKLYNEFLDKLRVASKTAIDAGYEERRVRALETFAETFTGALQAAFDFLGIPPADRRRVLPVIEAYLLRLEPPQ